MTTAYMLSCDVLAYFATSVSYETKMFVTFVPGGQNSKIQIQGKYLSTFKHFRLLHIYGSLSQLFSSTVV
jgi:hypothetical protein